MLWEKKEWQLWETSEILCTSKVLFAFKAQVIFTNAVMFNHRFARRNNNGSCPKKEISLIKHGFLDKRQQKLRFDVILKLLDDSYDSKPGRLYPTCVSFPSGGTPRCNTAVRNMYLHGYPSPCFMLMLLWRYRVSSVCFVRLHCNSKPGTGRKGALNIKSVRTTDTNLWKKRGWGKKIKIWGSCAGTISFSRSSEACQD